MQLDQQIPPQFDFLDSIPAIDETSGNVVLKTAAKTGGIVQIVVIHRGSDENRLIGLPGEERW